MAQRGLLSLLKRQLAPNEDDLSQEVSGTSKAARRSGPSLSDILLGAASGYAQGVKSGTPEAGLAAGFGSGYETARDLGQQRKVRDTLSEFEASPRFSDLSPVEQAEFRASPGTFFQKKRDPKPKTYKVRLSTLNPGVKPELDQEVELTAEDLVSFAKPSSTGDFANPALAAMIYQRMGIPFDPKNPPLVSTKDIAGFAALGSLDERKRAAQEKQDENRKKDLDTRVQKFSKTIDDIGIPEAMTQLRSIQNLLPPPGEDIPGYGRFDSLRPGLVAGKEGRALRQVVQGLTNVKIKDRSGAAVTPPEFVRLAKEMGSGVLKTEQELRDGLESALNAYKERLRNATAGFDPEVRGKYYENQKIDDYLSSLEKISFGGSQSKMAFNSIEEAEAANLPSGTKITIQGRPAVVD